MKYLGAITNDYDLVTKKYVDDATEVIQTLTSGTKIGSVGGTDLYAPSGGGGGSGTVTSVGITNGGGLSISGSPITSSGSITIGHSNSVTAGTIGSTSATSGASVSIPYATYDSNGHITGKGAHTHTITGFLTEETDPVFRASTAYYISYSDVDNWNGKLDGSYGTSGSTGITMGVWRIVWGTETMTTSSASGSGTFTAPYYVDTTVTFNSGIFSAMPYVYLQLQGGWTGSRWATPHDVSATSFKIRMYASHKNSTSTNIRWFAIGKA